MDTTLPLFYHDAALRAGTTAPLSEDSARHAGGVLRMGPGDRLRLTDGAGAEAECTITAVTKKSVTVSIDTVVLHPRPAGALHLAIAMTKNTARNEWLLEKATELGVQRITPLVTSRSNRERVRRERAEGILTSAMMQSGQAYRPQLDESTPLAEVLRETGEKSVYIAHCLADRARTPLAQVAATGRSVLLLIGPEGDFSPAEIEAAEAAGARAISLGNTRLRTETAAMAACSYFHLANEKESGDE